MATIIWPSGGDDAAAIQAALTAGQDVELQEGTYRLTGTASGYAVSVPAGRTVSGKGKSKTLVKLTGAPVTSCDAFYIYGVTGVTMRGMTIDGGRRRNNITVAGACINATSHTNYVSTGHVFDDLHLVDGPTQQLVLNSVIGATFTNITARATCDPVSAAHGVDLDATASAKPCDTITFTDCDLDSWGQESFKAENSHNITFTRTTFRQYSSLTQDSTGPYSTLQAIAFVDCVFDDFIQFGYLKQDPTNLYAGSGDVTFTRCEFNGNSGLIWGTDATAAHYGVITVTDCVFNGPNSYVLPAGVTVTASGNTGVKSGVVHYARATPSAKHMNYGSAGLTPYCAATLGAANIQNAVSTCATGDTVIALDGTYTGAGNYSISNGNSNLTITVKSETQHGAVIDGTGLSSVAAFTLAGTNTNKFSVYGFKIANFLAGTTGRGATINAANAVADFVGVRFENCGDANTGGGGGVRVQDALTTRFLLCEFDDCITSAAHAGGLLIDDGTATVSGCTFLNCKAQGTTKHGGGVYAGSTGNIVTLSMSGCTFTGCTATGSGGGAYFSSANPSGNTFTVANLTCSGNSATTSAPDVYFYLNNAAVTATLKNSICYSTGTPVVKGGTGGTLTATYNCIRGGYTGTGNISTDPLLNADLTIQSGSPCDGTGTNWWTTAPNPTGADGYPMQDLLPSMGAFQPQTHWLHPANL